LRTAQGKTLTVQQPQRKHQRQISPHAAASHKLEIPRKTPTRKVNGWD
jgi:hypothetical protein